MHLATATIVTLLILAAPAGAATVTLSTQQECPPKSGCFDFTVIAFSAAAGEVNDVKVTQDGVDYRLADAATPVTPGAGCRAVDAHTAVCTAPRTPREIELDLDDGDDRAETTVTAFVRASGGEGNDAIAIAAAIGAAEGGPGNDTLSGPGEHVGGPGDDRIFGGGDGGPGDDVIDQSRHPGSRVRLGPGADVYIGSPLDDRIEDAGGGDRSRDLIDGAGGSDTLSYEEATGPVIVDLGGTGPQDGVAGVEAVIGTRAGDTLRGDPEANRLEGGAGDDRIEGGGGNDVLDGGPGRDRLTGGDGADVLRTADGFFSDDADCGGSEEDSGLFDRGDRTSGCERRRVGAGERIVTHVAPAGGGRYRVHYAGWCDEWPSCRGTSRLHVRVRGRTLRLRDVRFSGRANVRPPRSRPFRLPAAARAQLRRTGFLRLRVTSHLDPGRNAGILPVEDRVQLRRSARKGASER
jgi:hypothetical protein